MDSNLLYSAPALVALAAKCGILYFSRTAKVQNSQTRLFFATVAFSTLLSLAEVALLNRLISDPPWTEILAYFAFSIPSLALLVHLSVSVSFDDWDMPRFRPIYWVLYGYAVLLEVLLLGTPWLVAGIEPFNGYSFTRVPGPLYFLYEAFLIISFISVLICPLFGIRQGRPSVVRTKCKLWLLATTPMAFLIIAIVVLLHLKIRWINSTVTLPLALAFFYAVVGYTIHNYRLFDIEFLLPWSKVRKRKTVFYRRIQTLLGEISQMHSVQNIIQSISDVLHCPIALIGGPTPSLAMAGEAFRIARFPLDELRKIDHIIVANEIAEAMPATYSLMKRHNVAAIVPFHPHSQAAANWMLLGDEFSEHVYSPPDFKAVETLFARLADHFLDNQVLLRAQLREAQFEMDALRARLANSWEEIDALRRKLDEKELANHATPRPQVEALHRDLTTIQADALGQALEKRSLDQHVADFEARLIAKTLEHSRGDVGLAAELLDLPIETLRRKLEQIAKRGIDPEEPQVFFV